MTLIDIDNLGPDDLAALLEKAASLVRRGGNSAAPPIPVQLELLDPPEPIDPATVDLTDKASDGNPRYVRRKEAAALYGCGVDKIKDMILKSHAGFQIGSTWFVDRTRLRLTRS